MNRELAAAKRRNSLASALSATYIFNVRLSHSTCTHSYSVSVTRLSH